MKIQHNLGINKKSSITILDISKRIITVHAGRYQTKREILQSGQGSEDDFIELVNSVCKVR